MEKHNFLMMTPSMNEENRINQNIGRKTEYEYERWLRNNPGLFYSG